MYDVEQTADKVTKVTAYLTGHESGRYTKLGRNLRRLERMSARMKALTDEVKQDTRELVGGLFDAEYSVATRVVETVNFTFQLTKDPKPTETYKYAKVFEELMTHMTPDLIKVAEGLLEKHKSVTQKAPALKATDRQPEPADESINEGIGDKVKAIFAKLKSVVDNFCAKYDRKLDQLKAEVGFNESIEETDTEIAPTSFNLNDLVRITKNGSNAEGEYGHISEVEEGYFKVTLMGMGYFVYCTADEVEPATPEEAKAFYSQGSQVQESVADLADWTENSGECPCDNKAVVNIMRKSGKTTKGVRAGSWQWGLEEEDPISCWQKSDRQLYEFDEEDEDDGFYNGLEVDPSAETFSIEDAVREAAHLLGLANPESDERSAKQMLGLEQELKNYGQTYTIEKKEQDGQAYVEFKVADSGNVNQSYGPMATAWIENGFYWES
jgi:hypothetical protein